MKVLLSYILPSGGMDTLNRTRTEELRKQGVDCHLLYERYGAGLQNIATCPTHVTENDNEIRHLLSTESFQAVVVSSNFLLLEKFRLLGYTGSLIYEVQGLGTLEQAESVITEATPYILAYADALLYPPTSHLIHLLSRFPTKLHFCFPNCLDTTKFQYREHTATPYPIIGWVGRLEPNKNWQECLEIVYRISLHESRLRLWFFEDSNLSLESERLAYLNAVKRLGLRKKIDIFSNIAHDQMADYLSIIGESNGLLLSTSIMEGFGYAVAEAISCRCPVLSTDSDGVRSFISHNVTGKFYPLGNFEQAVKESLELMRGPLRESIRTQGRALMEKSFSPSTYATNFIGMLKYLGVSV